jgi:uncharacterized protein YjdB
MKIGNWAFAAITVIIIAGFVFTGCDDGNPETSATETVVTSVTLNKTELGLGLGDDYTLSATVLPENAAVKTVTWSSSKTVIATVDENGKVTARSFGEAIITATAKNGKKAICVVTVGDIDATGVTVQPPMLALEIGGTHILTPDVQPPNAANKNVDFESDTPAVASVGFDGTVTARAVGSATITVTTRSGGFEASCVVSVSNISVTGVTLNKSALYLEVGDDETLIATVVPEKAFNKAVTWSSSNTNVATVDINTGKVTAVTNGNATITVTTTDGGKQETCAVFVATVLIAGVTLDEEFYVAVGGRKTLIPTVSPEDLNPKYKTVTWSSGTPGVATVSANGLVTGVSVGTAIITVASVKDPSKKDTCTVTVDLGMSEYMVSIPAGTFQMGSSDEEPERYLNEIEHSVTLTRGFYMYETPVSVWDFYRVMGEIPTWFFDSYIEIYEDEELWSTCPVDGVTWFDALEFCNKLSEIEGFTPVYTITDRYPSAGYPIESAEVEVDWAANGYRLPTEAEWEYACRAETTGPFHTGDNILPNTADDNDVLVLGEANYDGNIPYNDNEPGIYWGMPLPPYLYETTNAYGLYTMHGNLEEWCWDWYGTYESNAQTNPRGPDNGSYRVTRGGSWWDAGGDVRSAIRNGFEPDAEFWGYFGNPYVGFRIVRNAPSVPDTRAVVERSGTAKRGRVLPQGILQDMRTFKKKFDSSLMKPNSLRGKGVEE